MPDAARRPSLPRSRRSWLPAAALYAATLGYLLVRDIGAPIYDDGYFFKRFALNALEHGVYAWNLEDGPVYGSTSQAFQWLATAAAAIAPTHYVLAVKALAAVSLLGLGVRVLRWGARATDSARGPAIALVALGSPLVLTTVLTGMETACTLLALGLVLCAMFDPRGEVRMGPRRAALSTVVIYVFRPDAALIPAVAYAVPPLLRRELPWRYAAWLTGLMLATGSGLWAYYGTPLPLSFFMKTSTLQPYGEHLAALGLMQKRLHFGATAVFAAPLVALALHRRDPHNLALLGATAALWAYHLALTNEIMGYRGRFYVPGMVPLALAAMRADEAFAARARRSLIGGGLLAFAGLVALAYARDWIPTPADDTLGQIAGPSYVGLLLGAAWLLRPGPRLRPALDPLVIGALMVGAVLGWKPPARPRVRSDAALMRVHARQVTTVRGLFDVARCLPRARTVYHSEMGVTGLVLLRTRVVDLVGILSDHVLREEPFDAMCRRDRPEALFLPHRNYRQLNAQIRASPCFADYRRVVDRSSSPLHVREDLADDFLRCATDVHRWRSRSR